MNKNIPKLSFEEIYETGIVLHKIKNILEEYYPEYQNIIDQQMNIIYNKTGTERFDTDLPDDMSEISINCITDNDISISYPMRVRSGRNPEDWIDYIEQRLISLEFIINPEESIKKELNYLIELEEISKKRKKDLEEKIKIENEEKEKKILEELIAKHRGLAEEIIIRKNNIKL